MNLFLMFLYSFFLSHPANDTSDYLGKYDICTGITWENFSNLIYLIEDSSYFFNYCTIDDSGIPMVQCQYGKYFIKNDTIEFYPNKATEEYDNRFITVRLLKNSRKNRRFDRKKNWENYKRFPDLKFKYLDLAYYNKNFWEGGSYMSPKMKLEKDSTSYRLTPLVTPSSSNGHQFSDYCKAEGTR